MNSMKRNVACAALAVAVCGAGRADTIGWWRFEDGAAGTSAASLTNRMDASRLPGSAVGITGSGLPQFADAFADAVLWNPAESRAEANDRALRFSDGNGNAGRVEIASDAALSPQTFTLEFFFKYEGTGLPNWMPLVGRMNGESREAFYIRLHKTTADSPRPSISLRFHNAAGELNASADCASDTLADGRWHHVALRVCEVDGTWQAQCFADYVSVGTCKLTGPIYYADGYPLLIGGNFPGLIDEVRLSNEILEPSEFLRPVSPNADEDTALYLDFRPPLNQAPGASPASVSALMKGDTTTSADVPGATVRANVWAATGTANTAALHLATNAESAHFTGRLAFDDRANRVSDDDFTAEMFFKIDDLGDASAEKDDCAYLFCAPTWKLRVMREGGWLSGYFPGVEAGTTASFSFGPSVVDGTWHHVALVYTKTAGKIGIYFDGFLKREFAVGSLATTDPKFLTTIAGNMWDTGDMYQIARGAIDEVRITRRALKPAEFLTIAPYANGKLIHLTYEENVLDSSVNAQVFGGGWTNTPANPPTLSGRVPGKALLDATGAVVRETNAHSLRYENRYIAYESSSVLDRADFTLEFFYRASATKASAGVMRLVDNQDVNDFVWGLRTDATGRTLEVVASTATAANAVVATFPPDSLDGRWHHYAVNFKTVEANTAVTLYRDYETVGEATLNGRLAVADGVSRFYVGGGSAGHFDEIVIWDGEKKPDDFLRAKKSGAVLIIR